MIGLREEGARQGGLTIGGTNYAVQVIDKDAQSTPSVGRPGRERPDPHRERRPDAHHLDAGGREPGLRRVRGGRRPVHLDRRAVGGLVLRPRRQARASPRRSGSPTTSASASQNFFDTYTHLWPQVPTNKKVGVMWPNDADGNAIRGALGPLLKKAGYTIVDPGAYQDGTNDYTAQITKFKQAGTARSSTRSRSRPTSRRSGGRPPSRANEAGQDRPDREDRAVRLAGLGARERSATTSRAAPTGGRPGRTTRRSPGSRSKALGAGYTKQTSRKQWNQQLGAEPRAVRRRAPPRSRRAATRRTRPRSRTR